MHPVPDGRRGRGGGRLPDAGGRRPPRAHRAERPGRPSCGAGVTAVRDLAWPADRIFALADASELSSFNGSADPRRRARCSRPPAATPPPPRGRPRAPGAESHGPEDAAAAVAELGGAGRRRRQGLAERGGGSHPGDAALWRLCDAAHAADLPVTAHAQGEGQVERALGAGVDELAHTPWTQRLSEDDVVAAAAARMRSVSTLDIHSYGRDTPALHVALDNLRRFHAAGGEVRYGTDLGNGPIPPGSTRTELHLLARRRAHLGRGPPGAGARAAGAGRARRPHRLDEAARSEDLGRFDHLRLVVRAGRGRSDVTVVRLAARAAELVEAAVDRPPRC